MRFSNISKATLLLLTLAVLVPSSQLLTAQCKVLPNGHRVCKDLVCGVERGPLDDPEDVGPFDVRVDDRIGPGVRHLQINKSRRSHTCTVDIPDELIPEKAITFQTSLTVLVTTGIPYTFDKCSYTYTPSGKAKRTCHGETGAGPAE